MATTTKNAFNVAPLATRPTTANNPFLNLWQAYGAYADRQEQNRMLWYCMVLLVLPCAFMMPMAILMMFLTPTYHTFFIGLLILLLFGNVVLHVAQVKGRVFVPLFHTTIVLMTLIPLVTFLNV